MKCDKLGRRLIGHERWTANRTPAESVMRKVHVRELRMHTVQSHTPTLPLPPRDLPSPRRPESYLPVLDVSSRFGLRLRQLRHDRNMTQLRMAVDFGIDRTFISDVERGRKSISLPMLEILALGFRVSLSELLRDI